MSWFWAIIFLINFQFISSSEARHERNPSSTVVVGTVYCDTCFHQEFPKANHFISGATVALECKDINFREEVKTDKNGEFKVHLPHSIIKHANKIKGCSVKLISSNDPYCSIAATPTSSSFHLKSRNKGTNIFSAGFFTFKPLKKPQLCDKKPIIPNSNENFPPLSEMPFLPPRFKELLNRKVDQPTDFPFPPNPLNPIFPPNPLQPPPSLLPPNPFQPPPSIIPPIFPSPPPSVFPPLLPSPPSPPFFPLPPFPGIIPPPPPPPPPVFPIPLPPFPFPPTPGFPGPGGPPADISSQSDKRAP